jgi:hypothetical protein
LYLLSLCELSPLSKKNYYRNYMYRLVLNLVTVCQPYNG